MIKPSVKTLGYCQACAAAARENFSIHEIDSGNCL